MFTMKSTANVRTTILHKYYNMLVNLCKVISHMPTIANNQNIQVTSHRRHRKPTVSPIKVVFCCCSFNSVYAKFHCQIYSWAIFIHNKIMISSKRQYFITRTATTMCVLYSFMSRLLINFLFLWFLLVCGGGGGV